MKCTEIVLQDHVIIRRAMDIVDGMLEKLQDGQRIEIFDATTMLKFLRLFGDQYHQKMEEDVLFPALLRTAPNDSELVNLISEHGNERTLVAEIEEALMSRRGMAFFQRSHQLTALLRNHCEREEIVIRELAERCLSSEQDDEITVQFIASRTPVKGFASFSSVERRYPAKRLPEVATADRE